MDSELVGNRDTCSVFTNGTIFIFSLTVFVPGTPLWSSLPPACTANLQSHVFVFGNCIFLFYGCSVFLTLLALRVLCSLWPSAGDPRVCLMLPFLFSSLELCLSLYMGKADSARGLCGSCQTSRALLTGQCWQGRALCDRVIGETSRHTDFRSFLTRTLASGLHVFQSLPRILTRLSAALVSAVPQCHLLCILETHFWSVLMCSLVLSVSIFLVCGLSGR